MNCTRQGKFRIPVYLLLVCRQIYHEVALKPFSEPLFDVANWTLADRALGSFTSKMVPAQSKAIAHLRMADNQFFKITKSAASKLKGLEYVEVEFVARMTESTPNPLAEMERFKKNGGVEWLKNFGLKSVHFTTLVAGDTSMLDEEELEELEESILEWTEREEAEIMRH
jgi:hypothetical protein